MRTTLLVLTSTALAACGAGNHERSPAPILLFSGTGASGNDVRAVETILDSQDLSYSTADSSRLNGLSETQLQGYRLLIIPGGNFVDMSRSLTPRATVRIRAAVVGGLNYLGICAGAFLAGQSIYNTLDLTSVKFGFYSAERRGLHKSAVRITSPGGPAIDQYWEDGPQLTGWGDVVAKYPDGTPAVVEGRFGSGWVILSGIHAEAPESWRGGLTFATPANEDNKYAAKLIDAALHRETLAHY